MLVSLQPRGEKLLEKVVEQRIIELRANGRDLVAAIGALLETRGKVFSGKRARTEQSLRPRPGKRPQQLQNAKITTGKACPNSTNNRKRAGGKNLGDFSVDGAC